MTLRSIDDSDGKDNVKIAIVAKQRLGRPGGTLFPYISFPSLHDCDVNLVNLKLLGLCVSLCVLHVFIKAVIGSKSDRVKFIAY